MVPFVEDPESFGICVVFQIGVNDSVLEEDIILNVEVLYHRISRTENTVTTLANNTVRNRDVCPYGDPNTGGITRVRNTRCRSAVGKCVWGPCSHELDVVDNNIRSTIGRIASGSVDKADLDDGTVAAREVERRYVDGVLP